MTNAETVGPQESALRDRLVRLPAGQYFVSYSDDTHLESGDWVRLLSIAIDATPSASRRMAEELETAFWLEFAPGKPKNSKPEEQEQIRRILLDQVSQALVRTGILPPVIDQESLDDILELSLQKSIVAVPDTNALSTGTLHWLVRAIAPTFVWILPIVVSLAQIQQHHVKLKSTGLQKKFSLKNMRAALRSRSSVNASMRLLSLHEQQYEVLEIDPQLLRYVRPAGQASLDSDSGDVLEDRLLIEAIHALLGSARSRTPKRVVTSDVFLARMLHAESIPSLFLQRPLLDGRVHSVRYDSIRKSFDGATLYYLLWDLVHTFGKVRLEDGKGNELANLQIYWPEKGARQWIRDVVTVESSPYLQSLTAPPPSKLPVGAASKASRPGTSRELAKVPSKSGERGVKEAAHFFLSQITVPPVSLVQVFRLGGLALAGPTSLEGIADRIKGTDRPTADILKYSAEVLLRIGALVLDENQVCPTECLRKLDQEVSVGNLDAASKRFEELVPYSAFLDILKEKAAVKLKPYPEVIRKKLGSPSKESFDRLIRYPIYLGQAWSDGESIRDGMARPTNEILEEAFSRIFDGQQKDGLASVASLIPKICTEVRLSPWALNKQIEIIRASGGLGQFSFTPAAGKAAAGNDHVIAGALATAKPELVPMDRFTIGGRPVFTVIRKQ